MRTRRIGVENGAAPFLRASLLPVSASLASLSHRDPIAPRWSCSTNLIADCIHTQHSLLDERTRGQATLRGLAAMRPAAICAGLITRSELATTRRMRDK